MKCHEIKYLLADFIDGDLEPDTQSMIQDHLSACEECREEYAFLQAYKKEIISLPAVAAPANFLTDLHKRLDEPSLAEKIRHTLFFPLKLKLPLEAVGVAVLAAITILIFNPFEMGRQMTFQPESASYDSDIAYYAPEKEKSMKRTEARKESKLSTASKTRLADSRKRGAATGAVIERKTIDKSSGGYAKKDRGKAMPAYGESAPDEIEDRTLSDETIAQDDSLYSSKAIEGERDKESSKRMASKKAAPAAAKNNYAGKGAIAEFEEIKAEPAAPEVYEIVLMLTPETDKFALANKSKSKASYSQKLPHEYYAKNEMKKSDSVDMKQKYIAQKRSGRKLSKESKPMPVSIKKSLAQIKSIAGSLNGRIIKRKFRSGSSTEQYIVLEIPAKNYHILVNRLNSTGSVKKLYRKKPVLRSKQKVNLKINLSY
ncbi:MAG: hypothetical protein GY754_35015 [bacterium]|nr:hypothetical protein [bacterium]